MTLPNLLGIGQALYFCIPANEKLLENWDTVADRLFKIRHCQDIDGVERKLALFALPISPEALIQAMSQGLSLGSILADLSSPHAGNKNTKTNICVPELPPLISPSLYYLVYQTIYTVLLSL